MLRTEEFLVFLLLVSVTVLLAHAVIEALLWFLDWMCDRE